MRAIDTHTCRHIISHPKMPAVSISIPTASRFEFFTPSADLKLFSRKNTNVTGKTLCYFYSRNWVLKFVSFTRCVEWVKAPPALSPFSHQFTARTTPFATTRTRSRKKRKTASFSDSIKAILYLRANIMRRTFPVLFKSAKRKLSLLLRQGDLIPSQKKSLSVCESSSSTKSQKAEKHHRKQLFQWNSALTAERTFSAALWRHYKFRQSHFAAALQPHCVGDVFSSSLFNGNINLRLQCRFYVHCFLINFTGSGDFMNFPSRTNMQWTQNESFSPGCGDDFPA